ncbi:Centrosomal colon cancer autoantigen protein family [Popillia japonica]|uniref:Centrosomal colon cancer autoantigen protein family n=1 Tax=Popillia japonica TaxID=7064 RepID=A0AAW1IXT4_POPJA
MWKPPNLTKVEYKKKPDYADTAYRDAVSRLRILLAETYVPIRGRPLRELDSAGEETDNQSVISGGSRTSRIGRSRYHSPLTPRRYNLATPLRSTNLNLADLHHQHQQRDKLSSPSDPHTKWDTQGCHTAPPELMSFIERQEEYIEQLERESRFCRDELSGMLGKVKEDELSGMLGKVKEVISENECLHEKQKSNLLKSVFDHLETETETETDLDIAKNVKSPTKHRPLEGPTIGPTIVFELETETETDLDIAKNVKSPTKHRPLEGPTIVFELDIAKNVKSPTKHRPLEGPTIVFESRISELEAQLTQTKIDLKKAQDENETFKRKVSDGMFGEGLDSCKKQVENLQREKAVLQDTVSKLQSTLTILRDKENNTCDQVKRSLDVAEQAQYEKTAAEHEIRRLKDELERQHGKLRDAINEQSRRIADERSAVERRYSQQIEQLTAELGIQWEQTNKLQLELDKQRRENGDLRRELAQKQAHIDDLKKDMNSKIISLQSDIGVSGAEKSALEQQIATLQMGNERQERQAKQETLRLQAEMQSLRQRLDRADADLIHSRRENIRLTEQVATLEKELKMNEVLAEERGRRSIPSPCNAGGSSDIVALPPPKEDRERELSTMIQDIESKHAATVAELEGMIHSQNQLMDKLSDDCHVLTQKLEEANIRHKRDSCRLRDENDELMRKLETVWMSLKEIRKSQRCTSETEREENQPNLERERVEQQHRRSSKQVNHCGNDAINEPLVFYREEIRELQTNLDYISSRFTLPSKSTADQEKGPVPTAKQKPALYQPAQPTTASPREVSSTQKMEETKPSPIKTSKPVEQTVPQKPKEESKPIEKLTKDDQPKPQAEPSKSYQKEEVPYHPEPDVPEYVGNPDMQYTSEQYDPNQQYMQDQQYEVDQQYGDQPYMTQEQYEEQYGPYDPNAQYPEQQYDPNYAMSGDEGRYVSDQQYVEDNQYTSNQYPAQDQNKVAVMRDQNKVMGQESKTKAPDPILSGGRRSPEVEQKLAESQNDQNVKQYSLEAQNAQNVKQYRPESQNSKQYSPETQNAPNVKQYSPETQGNQQKSADKAKTPIPTATKK